MLQQPNREVTITVKPSNIPDSIDIDVSGMAIGDTLTVADVRDKVDYPITNEDDYTLVTVSAPRVEEESDDSELVMKKQNRRIIKEKRLSQGNLFSFEYGKIDKNMY